MLKPVLKSRPSLALVLLSVLALLSITLFMTLGVKGQWGFALPLRSGKLAALLLVAFCIGISAVLFQTISHNRILTPGIMGFDALYILIETIALFVFGLNFSGQLATSGMFVLEVVVMTGFACLLFYSLFSGGVRSLHLIMLAGIVFGLMFRSLSSFMVRIIDPNEFIILQDRLFASFNQVNTSLLVISTVTVALTSVIGWRLRHHYDVLSLGRDIAINLGVPYQRTLMLTLVLISVFVSVSTALVGPVLFLGLLVSNLAYTLTGSDKHRYTLPAAVLLGVLFLVGGQTLLERVFELSTPLSVVIEFIGGLLFIYLVTRKGHV